MSMKPLLIISQTEYHLLLFNITLYAYYALTCKKNISNEISIEAPQCWHSMIMCCSDKIDTLDAVLVRTARRPTNYKEQQAQVTTERSMCSIIAIQTAEKGNEDKWLMSILKQNK